ncbi:hypothetical protein L0N33_22870, partial [Roseburia faecis]|nr:hypothetical protein [Roseburia faecis]
LFAHLSVAGQLPAAHAHLHPSYFPASEQIMSRITKKSIFASLALMTFASQLMSATLPLPGSSPVAETLPKPAFAQTDQVL